MTVTSSSLTGTATVQAQADNFNLKMTRNGQHANRPSHGRSVNSGVNPFHYRVRDARCLSRTLLVLQVLLRSTSTSSESELEYWLETRAASATIVIVLVERLKTANI